MFMKHLQDNGDPLNQWLSKTRDYEMDPEMHPKMDSSKEAKHGNSVAEVLENTILNESGEGNHADGRLQKVAKGSFQRQGKR
jgi:hypothetical protein